MYNLTMMDTEIDNNQTTDYSGMGCVEISIKASLSITFLVEYHHYHKVKHLKVSKHFLIVHISSDKINISM